MTSSWPSLVSAPSKSGATAAAPVSGGAAAPAISYAPAAASGPPAAANPASNFPKAPVETAAPSAKPAAGPSDNTPVDPGNEGSVIAKLDRLGYSYYNSYEIEPDGGATIRAVERNSGALLTIHLDRSGHMTTDPGWKQ